jgi:sugar transferase (PEP-CTERM system associated)
MVRVFGHSLPLPPLILALVESILLSVLLYAIMRPLSNEYFETESGMMGLCVMLSLSAIITMLAVGLYSPEMLLDRRGMFGRALVAVMLAAPLTFLVTLLFNAWSGLLYDLRSYWRLEAALIWLLCLSFTRGVFSQISDLEIFRRRVLVVGSGSRALRIERLAANGARAPFMPVAFINACGDRRLVKSVVCEADPQDQTMERMARDLRAHKIVVATDDRRGLPVQQLLRCRLSGIEVVDYLAFYERETGRVDLDALQPSWFILSDEFRFGPISEFIKRSFDLIASCVMLTIFLPVLVIAALAIKLDSRGTIFYRQERVGQRGSHFVLLKFRSMQVDAEKGGAPIWAQPNDTRVTRVGTFIRKFRIDELPQLMNVLRGDMAVVGPRPERPFFVQHLAQNGPFYSERHVVRPGITGWAQINYPYGASIEDARQKLSYDLYYLKKRTLFLDLAILIQTARVILWPEGVRYEAGD